MSGAIKIFKEDGHFNIRIVDRLPKKGNARILYVLRGDSIDQFYRWNTFDSEFEAMALISQNLTLTTLNLSGLPEFADDVSALGGGLTSGDVYKTATGELRIKL